MLQNAIVGYGDHLRSCFLKRAPGVVLGERSLSSSTRSCVRDLASTRVPQGHGLPLATRWVPPLRRTLDLALALFEGGCLAWPLCNAPWCYGDGLHYYGPSLWTGLTPSGVFGGRVEVSFSLGGWEIPVSVGVMMPGLLKSRVEE